MNKLEKDGVEVYAYLGISYCSICQPEDMAAERMLEIVNEINPTGLDWDWRVCQDKHFATGHTNPCPCENDPNKVHLLLEC